MSVSGRSDQEKMVAPVMTNLRAYVRMRVVGKLQLTVRRLTMYRNFKLFSLFALLALLLSAASGVVVAQEPLPPQQEDSQHIPDLGPDEPGLTSGEGGYKVFGPRAVLFVPIQPLASSDKRSPLAL